MSQADDPLAGGKELPSAETSVENPLGSVEVADVPRRARPMSARRLALQGPLFLLALAGIGFGGALNWESRDQWRELLTGPNPSKQGCSAGSGCAAMTRSACMARSGCTGEVSANVGGCEARSCCARVSESGSSSVEASLEQPATGEAEAAAATNPEAPAVTDQPVTTESTSPESTSSEGSGEATGENPAADGVPEVLNDTNRNAVESPN